MSKMADLALQLDEQAVKYGLQGYQEALERGFTYEVAEEGTATLKPPLDEQEMAHKAWLEEKAYKLETLRSTAEFLRASDFPNIANDLERVASFFEKGEI